MKVLACSTHPHAPTPWAAAQLQRQTHTRTSPLSAIMAAGPVMASLQPPCIGPVSSASAQLCGFGLSGAAVARPSAAPTATVDDNAARVACSACVSRAAAQSHVIRTWARFCARPLGPKTPCPVACRSPQDAQDREAYPRKVLCTTADPRRHNPNSQPRLQQLARRHSHGLAQTAGTRQGVWGAVQPAATRGDAGQARGRRE